MAIKKVWYTGWNLKERWSLSQDDLLQYLLDGDLVAYPNITSEPYSTEKIKLLVQDYHENPWAYDDTGGPWGLRFRADDVLVFEKKHNLKQNINSPISDIDTTPDKKLRQNQEDKNEVQKIAKKVWEKYPLDIKYMKMHPDIKRIVGRLYKDRTVHGWLSGVAPIEVQRKGIRSQNYIKEQLEICKKLNIEVPKK